MTKTLNLLPELETEINLTEEQAAKLVGVKPITMRMWRYRDAQRAKAGLPATAKSPPYKVVNTRNIRYPLGMLRQWLRDLPTVNGIPRLPDNRYNATEANEAHAG